MTKTVTVISVIAFFLAIILLFYTLIKLMQSNTKLRHLKHAKKLLDDASDYREKFFDALMVKNYQDAQNAIDQLELKVDEIKTHDRTHGPFIDIESDKKYLKSHDEYLDIAKQYLQVRQELDNLDEN